MVLARSAGVHWGNAPLHNRLIEAKPRYRQFGHAHDSYGILKQDGIVFSNAALLDDMNRLVRKPRLFMF
jgi:Icc-related predicted phosphoesterase